MQSKFNENVWKLESNNCKPGLRQAGGVLSKGFINFKAVVATTHLDRDF